MEFVISNSNASDIDEIFRLYDEAIAYQRRNGFELWPRFSEELILKEIAGGRHWKITNGADLAAVFSVQYADPVIWMEKDRNDAVYLHRIAVNPDYKGLGMIRMVKEWAIEHCRLKGKEYLRMDTWGRNEKLRNYYIEAGFPYIGQQQLDVPHYGGSLLSLFEIRVK